MPETLARVILMLYLAALVTAVTTECFVDYVPLQSVQDFAEMSKRVLAEHAALESATHEMLDVLGKLGHGCALLKLTPRDQVEERDVREAFTEQQGSRMNNKNLEKEHKGRRDDKITSLEELATNL